MGHPVKETTLDSLINVPGTFINFWKFFQGVCSYLRGYVYWIWRFLDTKLEFSPKNPLYYNILLILSMGIRLYQGVRLSILKKSPGGMFIRESRVVQFCAWNQSVYFQIWHESVKHITIISHVILEQLMNFKLYRTIQIPSYHVVKMGQFDVSICAQKTNVEKLIAKMIYLSIFLLLQHLWQFILSYLII